LVLLLIIGFSSGDLLAKKSSSGGNKKLEKIFSDCMDKGGRFSKCKSICKKEAKKIGASKKYCRGKKRRNYKAERKKSKNIRKSDKKAAKASVKELKESTWSDKKKDRVGNRREKRTVRKEKRQVKRAARQDKKMDRQSARAEKKYKRLESKGKFKKKRKRIEKRQARKNKRLNKRIARKKRKGKDIAVNRLQGKKQRMNDRLEKKKNKKEIRVLCKMGARDIVGSGYEKDCCVSWFKKETARETGTEVGVVTAAAYGGAVCTAVTFGGCSAGASIGIAAASTGASVANSTIKTKLDRKMEVVGCEKYVADWKTEKKSKKRSRKLGRQTRKGMRLDKRSKKAKKKGNTRKVARIDRKKGRLAKKQEKQFQKAICYGSLTKQDEKRLTENPKLMNRYDPYTSKKAHKRCCKMLTSDKAFQAVAKGAGTVASAVATMGLQTFLTKPMEKAAAEVLKQGVKNAAKGIGKAIAKAQLNSMAKQVQKEAMRAAMKQAGEGVSRQAAKAAAKAAGEAAKKSMSSGFSYGSSALASVTREMAAAGMSGVVKSTAREAGAALTDTTVDAMQEAMLKITRKFSTNTIKAANTKIAKEVGKSMVGAAVGGFQKSDSTFRKVIYVTVQGGAVQQVALGELYNMAPELSYISEAADLLLIIESNSAYNKSTNTFTFGKNVRWGSVVGEVASKYASIMANQMAVSMYAQALTSTNRAHDEFLATQDRAGQESSVLDGSGQYNLVSARAMELNCSLKLFKKKKKKKKRK
jgi:hypothetical protein